MTLPRIAFLGTGLMGAPMASNLLTDGLQVAVWNRTQAKAQALRPLGAEIADTAVDAVRGADMVLCVLENGAVVEDVLFTSGLVSHLSPGALVVDMSSIAPRQAVDHSRRLALAQVSHLDAPVSGGPSGAVDRMLAIMVGGSAAAFSRATPVLERLGKPTHVGASGAGQLAKLCSQMILGAAMCAVSEVMMFARAHQIDLRRIPAALSGGFADSKVLQIHGKRMCERDFKPGGHVRTFLKDLDSAVELINLSGLDLPITGLSHKMFGRLAHDGYGEWDISSMLIELERRNPDFGRKPSLVG